MAVSDYSTTPASNTTISGTNIDEGCPPGNLNNATRQMMADIRVMYDNLPDVSGLAPLSSPAFTGQPTFTGAGAFRYNHSASLSSGREYFLADGDAYPASPVAGDVVNFYT